ncbi:hypothetical protein AWZ03_009422 [Drosophila navojoa]|uniref:Uncharacterized protein n=1 Tax=Drosophila navojoa TaxID=7232 RepID=A0A484B8M9_DRONA|nr:hypothetical protein AWZ03_009422 [Drosophila navojoa]
MSDSFSNWMPSLNLIVNTEDDDEQNSDPFAQNRAVGSRLSLFQNDLNNLSPLPKLYPNAPVYGIGPLTDDEKRDIARRNNAFVPGPAEAESQEAAAQQNDAE